MPETVLHEFAPAKINLALHILGRREDGYHELESLVAFADVGDRLTLAPGDALSLHLAGPMAPLLAQDEDNLVLKAVRMLSACKPGLRTGAFTLEKNLPLASGIGGGSTDAAAALRLLAQVNKLSLNDPDIQAVAQATGADVPVCLDYKARIMRGIGETLAPPLTLPAIPAVLVNPGIGVSTPAVFRELGLAKGERLRSETISATNDISNISKVITLLQASYNDLESPASVLAPAIKTVLDSLSETENCLFTRMSGSGATVFGLYPDRKAAKNAAETLRNNHPHWWIQAAVLG